MGNGSDNELGLSTLEILSALVILSLVTSISVVNIQRVIYRSELLETKSRIEEAIQEARLRNVRTGEAVNLKLYLENRIPNIVVDSDDALIASYGACPDGTITYTMSGRKHFYKLQKLTCALSETQL